MWAVAGQIRVAAVSEPSSHPGKIHEILYEFLIVVAPREYPALHGEQSIRERSDHNLVAIRRSRESRHQRNASTLRHQQRASFME